MMLWLSGQVVHVRCRQEIITNQVDESSRYTILQDGTLMIENARESDEGVYECVARNQLGEVKAEAVELRYLDSTRPGVCVYMVPPKHPATLTTAAQFLRNELIFATGFSKTTLFRVVVFLRTLQQVAVV